jgi:hypothetical protein
VNKYIHVFFRSKTLFLEILIAILVIFVANTVRMSNYKQTWEFEKSDLFYEYSSGIETGAGYNPYKKILDGDLLINRKYATLFPLYYLFLFAVTIYSNFSFEKFLVNYRELLFGAQLVAALFIYLIFRRENKRIAGVTASLFFIFNRWSINVLSDGKQDFFALAFLMGSLYFFKSKRYLSFLLYGFSLGIKHLGIFIAPFYLLPVIQKKKIQKSDLYCYALLLIPTLLPSIYYIFDNAKSFIYSMAFSFTRKSATTSIPSGYEKLLILYDIGVKNNTVFFYIVPRLPLVISYLLSFASLFFKKITGSQYLLLTYFFFVSFNPVLFDQYITWITPFVLFPLIDIEGNKVYGN